MVLVYVGDGKAAHATVFQVFGREKGRRASKLALSAVWKRDAVRALGARRVGRYACEQVARYRLGVLGHMVCRPRNIHLGTHQVAAHMGGYGQIHCRVRGGAGGDRVVNLHDRLERMAALVVGAAIDESASQCAGFKAGARVARRLAMRAAQAGSVTRNALGLGVKDQRRLFFGGCHGLTVRGVTALPGLSHSLRLHHAHADLTHAYAQGSLRKTTMRLQTGFCIERIVFDHGHLIHS